MIKIENTDEQISLSKAFYTKEALLKAAFAFLDRAYVHLNQDDNYWIISMRAKRDSEKDLTAEFENELLAQEVRRVVYKRTHSIRELLLARAMASSLVTDDDPVVKIHEDEESVSNEELNQILQDWYNKNER